MSTHRMRYGSAALFAVGLAAAGMTPVQAEPTPTPVAPPTAPAPSEGGGVAKDAPQAEKMSSHSQELLIEARSTGKARVTVMTLTEKGKAGAVADQLRSMGASVGYVQDRLGYVRASVATKDALKVAKIAQVQRVDLDEMLASPKPVADPPGPGTGGSGPWTGPDARTPAENPYLPTAETGAVAFKKAHPEWDGRGTTIGILDSGVDLDHPALQETSTGQLKVSNWITVTDPLLESDGTWRPMIMHVKGPEASYAGATWKLPDRPEADFAMNVFKESSAIRSDEIKGDIDRDGKTTSEWGVLYDYKSGDVWVDVNGNHDFTDEKLMRPYKERQDVNHFGKDDPSTSVRETMPFVTEFRKDVDLSPAGLDGRKADFVNIGLVASAHGTHVAGIAAGHKLFDGLDGAAPGAKVVSAKACVFSGGCTAVALTEGMIELVANQHVDVVNMSIGGLPALNDGNTTRTALYNRIIDEYGVQLFISAGNEGPGTNTVGDPSVATDVVSVAAGASKNTWLANYGAKVSADFWAQNYSSRGPREDGGFKPNIIAPGSAISSVPMFLGPQDMPDVSYKLPTGYAMFNGTSMASPQATGAATLLLSAARQSDVAVTPKALRASIYSTTNVIKGLDVASQGSGLIQVDRAWEVLKKAPKVENAYEIKAPVCTPLSGLLAEKDKGEGLYNRCAAESGGQRAGEAKTYDVTITRTAGPVEQVTHKLTMVGDDGTFNVPKTVDLPVGTPVTVKVSAMPRSEGAHSALLTIDSPATAWVDSQMMADVVVAHQLQSTPFQAKTSGSVERARTQSFFVTVPPGTKALQMNLSGIANGSVTRFMAINPYGLPVDKAVPKGSCYTNNSDPTLCNPTSRAYIDPMPGIWEFQVEASRRTPTTANPYTLTAAVQGVTVDPAVQKVESAVAGKPAPVSWKVTNTSGPVQVSGEGGPLGSAFTARPTIKKGERQSFKVVVPAGVTRLEAKIGNPEEKTADLDLFLKDPSGRELAKSAAGGSDEIVAVDAPAPGTYTVEVEGYAVANDAGTTFDYLDVFFGDALGSLKVNGLPKTLKTGESTQITGTVIAKADAGEGRRLFGEMRVVSAAKAQLGSGQVVIEKVTKP
ncbi:hypothetical protein KEM60_02964 [Austwickia sp. TVS 96-490-7B]|uniref:S8 family serine peptidase n=1 Tax=Austwickia sp. TVS 96-490-7B TaxID=2830843 RepID=UPI001C5688CE|nr:S8 family serine peptidase [Austwickia sp. TVS 96-490-7B]MBW3086735.1 hypothetical protein [Austwickia sp. TVS 96-490-7B]